MLPKILKFGFFIVFILLTLTFASRNNKAFAAGWVQQSCSSPGTFGGYCSSVGYWTSTYCDTSGGWVYYYDPTPSTYCGCSPAQCGWSGWSSGTCSDTNGCANYSYCYPAGAAYQYCLYNDPTCYANASCPSCNTSPYLGKCASPGATQNNPQPCYKSCPGISYTVQGVSVEGCQSNYCWYDAYYDPANSGNNNQYCYATCPAPTCQSIGSGGFVGTCTQAQFGATQNNPTPCNKTCPNGKTYQGVSVEGCQTNYCWYDAYYDPSKNANDWCYYNCPGVTQNTQTCTSSGWTITGSSCTKNACPTPTPVPCTAPYRGSCTTTGQTQNVSDCTYTCPGGSTVAGYTVQQCQANLCWYDAYWDTNAPPPQSQYCYPSTSCPPLSCNSGLVCTPCAGDCSPGNTNTRTCTYTTRTDGLACNQVSVTCGQNGNQCPDGSICRQSCPNNFSCGGSSCNPSLSIAGNVYVDTNSDTYKNGAEVNFTNGISTLQLNNGTTVSTSNGVYSFDGLYAGTYTVSYLSLPSGYSMTYPPGVPPTLTITIGNGTCSANGAHDATCNGGSISGLDIGITNNKPWIQCQGQDCRVDAGFKDKIPASSLTGAYASLNGAGGTPGLIFTGNATPDFGNGQASANPYNWIVGGPSPYSETFSPTKVGGVVKTSYNYISSKVSQGNITPIDLSTVCNIASCTLPANLAHGIYKANGNLNLTGGGIGAFTSSNNYVILVNGDLTISTKISVPSGATLLFTTSRDINIDKSIGQAASDSSTTIEGIYSADRNFNVQGFGGCSVQPDLRFNVGGSVIANGAGAGGGFVNNRDLCGSDPSYPTVSFFERVDFILYTPEFLKNPNFTYQEIAP